MIEYYFPLGLAAMKDALSELEDIWSRCIENDRKYMFEEILDLLKKQGTRGIGIRQDDGELWQLTLSRPTRANSAFAIGLRYVKRDGTQTEDLIPVQKGRPIKGCYRGSLQRQWPEYGGTHRQKVLFTIVENEPAPTWLVNTITLVLKKDSLADD